jgi:hypothetical protein
MEIRKGFYFSFDAILALTVMSATLVMMLTMMGTNYSQYNQDDNAANNLRTESRDVMSLASAESFETYNESFQDELVANSVMSEEDMDKTVLNGITYLWAAGNFSYAEEATESYFGPRVDGNYQIQIKEGGKTYTLPQDVERPEKTEFVTTASSLVSGHRLNASNSGYRARASVLQGQSLRTEISPISPSGNLPDAPGRSGNGRFETTKYVPIKDDDIVALNSGTLDLNLQQEPSDDFQVFVNGNEVPDSNAQLLDSESGGGGEGGNSYYRYNIAEYLEIGQNNSITYTTESIFFEGGLLNPGSRVEINYTKTAALQTDEVKTRRIPLKYVYSEFSGGGGGGEQSSGIVDIENFGLPRNSEIISANLTVDADSVGTEESPDGWDVQATLNEEVVIQESANGQYQTTVDITDQIKPGSNLMRILINHDGSNYWGGQNTVLNSNPGTADHSYIEVKYRDKEDVGYGKYESTISEEFGQNGNPVTYERQFTDYDYFSKVGLYMSVFDADNTEVEVKSGTDPYQTIFSSSETKPTFISIGSDIVDFDQNNFVRLSDANDDTRFLEHSLFEYSTFVEPRVGYGPVFDSEEAAQEDAVERLENKSGDFFNFENIEPSSVTIGGERRLWGPSTVTLVRWEE